MLRQLSPGPWFNSVSEREYVRRYSAEVLAALDPSAVVAKLAALGDGRDVALACFESPADDPAEWCHRGLVSLFLHQTLGLEVREFGSELCGPKHPKLPSCLR